MHSMVICPNCGDKNKEGELYCACCGGGLHTRSSTPQRLSKTSAEPIDRSRWGTGRFDDNNQLIIHVQNHPKPIIVRPGPQLVLGRSDLLAGVKPDQDLTMYRAIERGVSRTHAAIRRTGKTLFIEDLGSSNGTWLNGLRLLPGRPHKLHDGDEVRLGSLVMHIYFL